MYLPTLILLIDNEKAFGINHWNKLRAVMKEKRHPAYLTKTVQRMYRNTKCTLQDGLRTGSKHFGGSNPDIVKDVNEIRVSIFTKIW
jgi:hypothetical protein